MVISGLLVVEYTFYRIFIHTILVKEILISVGNDVAAVWGQDSTSYIKTSSGAAQLLFTFM